MDVDVDVVLNVVAVVVVHMADRSIVQVHDSDYDEVYDDVQVHDHDHVHVHVHVNHPEARGPRARGPRP